MTAPLIGSIILILILVGSIYLLKEQRKKKKLELKDEEDVLAILIGTQSILYTKDNFSYESPHKDMKLFLIDGEPSPPLLHTQDIEGVPSDTFLSQIQDAQLLDIKLEDLNVWKLVFNQVEGTYTYSFDRDILPEGILQELPSQVSGFTISFYGDIGEAPKQGKIVLSLDIRGKDKEYLEITSQYDIVVPDDLPPFELVTGDKLLLS